MTRSIPLAHLTLAALAVVLTLWLMIAALAPATSVEPPAPRVTVGAASVTQAHANAG